MDYVTLIGEEYPDIEVHVIGNANDYDNITWLNPAQQIPKATLDERKLVLIKKNKIIDLSNSCEKAIIGGFISNALGADHLYDSEEVDQINLIGAVTSTAPTVAEPNGYSSYYACRDVSTGIKSYIEHSHFVLRQVMADGALFKLNLLQRFHMFRSQVEGAVDEEQINAIIW